ncbi:hypothetical protein HYDPIDRAFT_120407 [Hydnomerulius pinastri MD-312]|uniref:Uncharacterized protein n=1 Tax=Hydnomerulius pinastri MD-312 TaxID=994086 RepID=A0A0C9VWV4_9AGAM|nr:hypothetical protein HYDPIDRAFT_120407 [Hydnomerulius pinastri MD-312]
MIEEELQLPAILWEFLVIHVHLYNSTAEQDRRDEHPELSQSNRYIIAHVLRRWRINKVRGF